MRIATTRFCEMLETFYRALHARVVRPAGLLPGRQWMAKLAAL